MGTKASEQTEQLRDWPVKPEDLRLGNDAAPKFKDSQTRNPSVPGQEKIYATSQEDETTRFVLPFCFVEP